MKTEEFENVNITGNLTVNGVFTTVNNETIVNTKTNCVELDKPTLQIINDMKMDIAILSENVHELIKIVDYLQYKNQKLSEALNSDIETDTDSTY